MGEALLADDELVADAEVDEATELSWAMAPVAATAARSATGKMLNFILRVCE